MSGFRLHANKKRENYIRKEIFCKGFHSSGVFLVLGHHRFNSRKNESEIIDKLI